MASPDAGTILLDFPASRTMGKELLFLINDLALDICYPRRKRAKTGALCAVPMALPRSSSDQGRFSAASASNHNSLVTKWKQWPKLIPTLGTNVVTPVSVKTG
jgi:hypothetical protein